MTNLPRPDSPARLTIDPLSREFSEPMAESAYLAQELPRTRRQLAFTLLLCSVYFLGFFATDLAALGLVADTALLLGARLLVAVVAGSCAWLAWRRPLSVAATRLAASVAEIVALACFMLIAVHRPGEFHWHAMSLAIMLLVVYLYIPNRIAYSLAIAAATTAVFVALTLAYGGMGFADLLTMGMLLSLVNSVGALAARRYGRAAREAWRAQQVLQDAAERDHQTGCYNRRYLHGRLDAAESPFARNAPLAVILCDIDHFKRVNDAHGHGAGDAVLLHVATLLQGVAREGIDSVVRYGGEEFLLVLPGTGLDAAIELAEWLRSRLGAAPVPAGRDGVLVAVSASFGVAATVGGAASLEMLIDAADKLLYAAKAGGRDRVEALALPVHARTGVDTRLAAAA